MAAPRSCRPVSSTGQWSRTWVGPISALVVRPAVGAGFGLRLHVHSGDQRRAMARQAPMLPQTSAPGQRPGPAGGETQPGVGQAGQCQPWCGEPALADERGPLRLFDPILSEERRQREGDVGWQGDLAPAKGGLQSLAQRRVSEGGTPRHYQEGGYDQACLSGAQVPWV